MSGEAEARAARDLVRLSLSDRARAHLAGCDLFRLRVEGLVFATAEELLAKGLIADLRTLELTPEGAEVARLEKEAADGR